jgi:hypothetical protein
MDAMSLGMTVSPRKLPVWDWDASWLLSPKPAPKPWGVICRETVLPSIGFMV